MTIQTNEDFTHSLLEQTKTMVCGFDLESRLLYSNQYAQEVLGYTASELTAVPFNTLVTDHKKAAFAQAVLKAQTEGSAAIDLVLRRKNGSQCTISAVLSRWQHEGTPHIAFFGVEALRESDEMSVTILLHSLPGFAHRCLNDPDWTTLFITEGVTEITGYPVSDFVQNSVRTYNSIIHPDDQPRDWEETQTQLRSNRYFETRYRIITAAGEERWVWDYGRGIYDKNDNIIALEGLIVDITQQKHIEAALLQSEQRYSTLIESIPDLMFRVNGEGKFLDFKPSRRLSVPPDQIIGKKIAEYQLQVGNELEDFEARVAFINPNEVFCIVRDITERKRTERELYESEERLNLLTNNTPVMLYALDKDLRVTFARGEILERLNYRTNQVLGQPVQEVAKDFPIIIENMERARQGTPTTFTMSQPPFTFLVMATPLIDKQGQIAGVAGAVTDITQEHLTEQALPESNESARASI
ncbi:MAG: PAS domain S-box protein [Anaerolineae bacterium]